MYEEAAGFRRISCCACTKRQLSFDGLVRGELVPVPAVRVQPYRLDLLLATAVPVLDNYVCWNAACAACSTWSDGAGAAC